MLHCAGKSSKAASRRAGACARSNWHHGSASAARRRDGRFGAPLDLYDNPANVFVAGFIGSPAMNFIKGRIAKKDGAQQFVSDGGSILPVRALNVEDGLPAIYGIRPEHITIGDGGLPVRVSVLEPTGAETQIFARADDDLIDAVIKERLFLKPGDEVPFLIDPANTHYLIGRRRRDCSAAGAPDPVWLRFTSVCVTHNGNRALTLSGLT
jgi:hypothetical protein